MGPSRDPAAVGTSPTRQRPADRVGRIHLRRAVLSLLVLRGTVAAPVPGHAVSPALLPAAVTQASAGEGLMTNWWVAHGFAALTLCLAGVLVWRSSRTRRAAARWTTYLTSLALISGTVIAAMLTALLYVNAASGLVPSLTALQALFDTGAGSAVTTAPPVPAPRLPGAVPLLTHDVHSRSRQASGSRQALPGTRPPVHPPDPRPQVVPGPGSLLQVSLPDPALGVPTGTTDIYLPAGYAQQAAAGARYPVVYLIHGYPGGPSNWMLNGGAPQAMDALQAYGYARPMIIVSVDAVGPSHGTDWGCLNTVGGPQLETYLTRDVITYLDSRFATVAQRSGRAIGGMSSGAFCALNIGLRHQDLYTAILAIEPYGDPGAQALRLLGGSTTAWADNSPRLYLPQLVLRRPLTVYLADGSHSPSRTNARQLAAEFERAGINPVLQIIDSGGHDWTTARLALPYALQVASQAMSRPTDHVSA